VSRTVTAAFAALQLLGATLWPLVDARLEAAERLAVSHIEAERQAPCAPGHDDFFCQVCRTVSLAGNAAAHAIYAFDSSPVLRVAGATLPKLPRYQTLSPSHGPRAPPLS
jgi:hypothetical protein